MAPRRVIAIPVGATLFAGAIWFGCGAPLLKNKPRYSGLKRGKHAAQTVCDDLFTAVQDLAASARGGGGH